MSHASQPPVAFEYAVVRAVPRIEREEFVNIGVIVYCQARSFLDASVDVDPAKLRAIDREADTDAIATSAASFVASYRIGTSRDGRRNLGEVFRWLTSPRSTVIQTGPVHTGMTDDPAAELEHLTQRLVH